MIAAFLRARAERQRLAEINARLETCRATYLAKQAQARSDRTRKGNITRRTGATSNA